MRKDLSNLISQPTDRFTYAATAYTTNLLEHILGSCEESFEREDREYTRFRDYVVGSYVPDELSLQCAGYLDERRRHSRGEASAKERYKNESLDLGLRAWSCAGILLGGTAAFAHMTWLGPQELFAPYVLTAAAIAMQWNYQKKQLKAQTIDAVEERGRAIDAEYTNHLLTTLNALHHNVYNKTPSASFLWTLQR